MNLIRVVFTWLLYGLVSLSRYVYCNGVVCVVFLVILRNLRFVPSLSHGSWESHCITLVIAHRSGSDFPRI